MRRALLLAALAAGFASRLPADFSYRQTTTVSGTAALGMAGRPGQIAAPGPLSSTIAVKDSRLLARFLNRATVVDLNRQTVTEIDFARRTCSVATFDEISRAQSGAAVIKSSVKATGNTRQISGFDTGELVLKLEPPGAETGPIAVDLWMAPAAAGYAEMRDLLRRLSAAIEWSPWSSLFPARPEIASFLAALFREAAKAEGMPVLEITSVAQPPQAAGAPRIPFAAGAAPAGQWGRTSGAGAGPLFEIRTEMSGFSNLSVDEADFEIPPGFRAIPAEILQPAKR